MQAFDETVGLGMIGRRCECLDSPGLGQLEEYFRRELTAPVRGDGGRNTEVLNPTIREGVGDRFRRDVDEGNGYGPPSESVHSGQKVLKPIGPR